MKKKIIISFLDGRTREPKTFGQLGQDSGYVLYETLIEGRFTDPAELRVTVHDRGHVFVDEEVRGILSRMPGGTGGRLPISVVQGSFRNTTKVQQYCHRCTQY